MNTLTKTPETSAVASKQGRTPGPTDLIFPKWQRELFKTILDDSLRRTYICLRLMEGRRHLQNR